MLDKEAPMGSVRGFSTNLNTDVQMFRCGRR